MVLTLWRRFWGLLVGQSVATREPPPRLWLALVTLIVAAGTARGDYLVVSRAVSLKSGPSAAADPVGRVEVGQVLSLATPGLSSNYYQVSAPVGRTSWIYRGFVTLQPGSPPAPAAAADAGVLKVRVFNVGQGDAILITCPDGDHQLLIDSGDTRYPGSAKAFKNAMTELQPTSDKIEVVIATHPHADHIGSMAWVLTQYDVGLFVDDGLTYDSATFRAVEQAISQRGVHRAHANATAPDIDFCPRADVSAVVLRPQGFGTLKDPNDDSVVVRVDFGADSFLFVGDTEREQEQQLLDDPATKARLDCDFLKVGHHGSDTSSGRKFLDAVTPRIAAVSAGMPGVSTNAGYMHPRRSTIEHLVGGLRGDPGPPRRLRVYDADAEQWTTVTVRSALYCTSLEGDLLFESTGSGITFRPGR